MGNRQILLAEDDYDFGSILKQYLEIHQFEVVWANDGKEALDVFKKAEKEGEYFDICVFDVMMPKMDGFSLAEKIIEIQPETPFIFLTAKKMKEDKVKGLKLGADDYIVKPFEADILVLKINNIIKRTGNRSTVAEADEPNNVKKIGGFVFDNLNHTLVLDGEKQHVTEKEAQLIDYLNKHKNEMIKRDTLLTDVWGSDDFFSGRSMDVFISRLRKYFKGDSNISIESTRNVGLTFKVIENK